MRLFLISNDYSNKVLNVNFKILLKMEIKIIESMCCGSKVSIKEMITKVLVNSKINANISVISDYKEIASLGIMTFPVILINDKIVFKGGTPTYKEFVEIINNEI